MTKTKRTEEENGLNPRKSQVDKFNSKWAKNINDQNAMAESSLNKEPEQDMKGTKELSEQGNIQEAAMVVSYEGLRAFSKIFTNSVSTSVESAIDSRMTELESRFEKILEDKLNQVLNGMTEGIAKYAEESKEDTVSNVLSILDAFESKVDKMPIFPTPPNLDKLEEDRKRQIAQKDKQKEHEAMKLEKEKKDSEESIQVPVHGKLLLEEIDEETRKSLLEKVVQPQQLEDELQEEPQEEVEQDNTDTIKVYSAPIKDKEFEGEVETIKSAAEDLDLVTPMVLAYMRSKAEPVKLSEIVEYLLKYEGIKVANPTNLMKHIMKETYYVLKVGHGLYQYEEKTFRSIH